MLTANRTYYVRTDGSDSNTGLANTSGGAFATVQHAFDVIAALDLSTYSATIEIGLAGTYAGVAINAPLIGGTALNLVGNGATMTSSSMAGTIQVTAAQNTPITVAGFTLTNTAGSGACIRLDAASKLTIGAGMTFGAAPSSHMRAGVPGAYVTTNGSGYTISGGASYHMMSLEQGGIRINGGTTTLTGTPAFTGAFAYASLGAHAFVTGVSFSGSATGPRYAVATGGIVATNGAGATYLPGNSAGTNDGTGVYA